MSKIPMSICDGHVGGVRSNLCCYSPLKYGGHLFLQHNLAVLSLCTLCTCIFLLMYVFCLQLNLKLFEKEVNYVLQSFDFPFSSSLP